MIAWIKLLRSTGVKSVEQASSLFCLNRTVSVSRLARPMPQAGPDTDAGMLFTEIDKGSILRYLMLYFFPADRQRLILAVALAATTAVNHAVATEPSKPLNVQIEPQPGGNFSYGVFQCWLPESGVTPKGVLCIVLHPRGHRGALLAESAHWRQLASQYDCALVAASFAVSSDSAKPWGRAMLGSGAALLRAIDQFSAETGLPAMKSVPIVLAGVCEAGQFAHEFAAFAPVRTAAFVTIGGGKHNLEIADEAAGIPGLFVVCRDRGAYAVENILTAFAAGRRVHAPWGTTFESINAYDAGRSSSTVQAFLRSALAFAASDQTDLRMKLADGDLHPVDHDSEFPVSEEIRSWLPENVAESVYRESETDFSFVSKEVPRIASITSGNISAGNLKFGEMAPIEFAVASDQEDVTELLLANGNLLRNVQIDQTDSGRWEIRGDLDLSELPSGTFRAEIPVRFASQSGAIFGGKTAIVTGSVHGDVVPAPNSLNLGRIPVGHPAVAEIVLKSRSGRPIELLGAHADSAQVIAKPSNADDLRSTRVKIEITPSATGDNGAFSGNLYLTVKSDETRTLKILFYGIENT